MSSTFGEIISSPRDVVDDYECVAYSEPICPPTAQRFTATAPSSPATSPWHTRVAVPSRAWYSWSCSPNLELPSTRWSRDRHNFAYPRSPDNDMGSLCPCLPTRYHSPQLIQFRSQIICRCISWALLYHFGRNCCGRLFPSLASSGSAAIGDIQGKQGMRNLNGIEADIR